MSSSKSGSMSESEGSPVAPPRLREQNDAVGRLLREESQLPLPQPSCAAHGIVREYRRRSARRRWSAIAVSAVLLSGVAVSLRREQAPLSIGAERIPPFRSSKEFHRAAEPSPARAQEMQAQTKRPAAPAQRNVTARPRSAVRAEPAGSVEESKPAAEVATTAEVSDCASLTHAGKYQDAVGCYSAKAKGSGVSAELALLERARLERRVLGDSTAALATLDEYRVRFANGALFREAALARIEVLMALGRNEPARRAIERIVDQVPERAAELSLLGARLAVEAGACGEATDFIQRARRLGTDEARLSELEQRCTQ